MVVEFNGLPWNRCNESTTRKEMTCRKPSEYGRRETCWRVSKDSTKGCEEENLS